MVGFLPWWVTCFAWWWIGWLGVLAFGCGLRGCGGVARQVLRATASPSGTRLPADLSGAGRARVRAAPAVLATTHLRADRRDDIVRTTDELLMPVTPGAAAIIMEVTVHYHQVKIFRIISANPPNH